ncbi:Protein of unknown function [Bacillus mycoides]|uniref:Uncharacterized protein n=1 Tax=Bacillus mycoides TaxID=1405 RepID=A0A1C3TDQ1_BACMY|nr:Protein of unknown function [Bacillus mycoides]SCB70123.1 Protein of unknown function [Bacillus mycoides]SCC54839.1 Protein of unknown function [Bacillus mycoides]SCM88832.1 Protein of unknown function [Bacillus mycoides]SCM97187.1 Protein of unknown function [Bacillus mycoides]
MKTARVSELTAYKL